MKIAIRLLLLPLAVAAQALRTTGGGETGRSAHFVREGGGRRFTGATPASERRQCRCLAARYNRLLSIYRAASDGGGEIGDGREAFSAQVSGSYFKGHRPELHSSSSSLSLSRAHDMYVPSFGWYMDWSEVDSRADLQCQCSFSRQNQNEVDGR